MSPTNKLLNPRRRGRYQVPEVTLVQPLARLATMARPCLPRLLLAGPVTEMNLHLNVLHYVYRRTFLCSHVDAKTLRMRRDTEPSVVLGQQQVQSMPETTALSTLEGVLNICSSFSVLTLAAFHFL